MLMADEKCTCAAIEFMGPDQLKEGLGYCICTDGNQTHPHKILMKDMVDVCQMVESVY